MDINLEGLHTFWRLTWNRSSGQRCPVLAEHTQLMVPQICKGCGCLLLVEVVTERPDSKSMSCNLVMEICLLYVQGRAPMCPLASLNMTSPCIARSSQVNLSHLLASFVFIHLFIYFWRLLQCRTRPYVTILGCVATCHTRMGRCFCVRVDLYITNLIR